MLPSGSLYDVRYIAEVTPGITPATPTLKTVRKDSAKPDFKRSSFKAEELRSDRQVQSMRLGTHQAAFSLGTLLMKANADDFIQGALAGTWDAVTTGAISLQIVASTSKVVRTTGSFITDGFDVGDIVALSGFTTPGNNITSCRVSVVSALELTLELDDGDALTNEAAAAARTVAMRGKKIKAGNATMKTYSIEGVQPEIPNYELFTGMAVNQMQLQIKPNDNVRANFEFVGLTSESSGSTVATAVTAAVTHEPMDSFSGYIYENNVETAIVTSLDLTVSNGRKAADPVIGNPVPPGIVEGTNDSSGTMTVYFSSAALADKFRDETATSLDILMLDPTGLDFIRICLPNVKLMGFDKTIAKDSPVTAQIAFQALLDSTSGTNIIIQRGNP